MRACSSIVDGVVLEGVELEVRVELAIQPGEQVQIERGSDAAAVVVGGVQHGCVLADVDAEQERAAGHALGERWRAAPPRERARGCRSSSPGRTRASARVASVPRQRERAREIGEHGKHGHVWITRRRLPRLAARGRRPRCRRAHSSRADRGSRAAGAPSGSSRRRARRTSARGPTSAAIVRGVGAQQPQLRSRRVVLGQRADLVEQLRAALVVEVLRREMFLRGREAGQYVVGGIAARLAAALSATARAL